MEEKDNKVFLYLKRERPWKKQGKKLTAQKKICINRPGSFTNETDEMAKGIMFNQLVRNCTHVFLVEILAGNFNSVPRAKLISGGQSVETPWRSSRAPQHTTQVSPPYRQRLRSCAPRLLQSLDQEPRFTGLPSTCQSTVIQRDTGPRLL